MANRSEHQRSFESPNSFHKGIMREVRLAKRQEAEERNSHTAPDKRRAFWRDRGFARQSQAASLVKGTVLEINTKAKEQKQRSADWPLLPEGLIA